MRELCVKCGQLVGVVLKRIGKNARAHFVDHSKPGGNVCPNSGLPHDPK